jgi:Galactose oxidase, central domain
MRKLICAVLLTLAPATLYAQGLTLDATGGSLPGNVQLDLHNGPVGGLCFILTGITPGPTQISMFDRRDTRSVSVGTQVLGNSFAGVFGLDQHFRVGPLSVPASPSLVDAAFFFQGVNLPGATTLVDQISNPHALRFANAAAFRDRNVAFQEDRAFGVVLPRADGNWMIVGGGRGGLLAQVATRTTSVYDELTDTFSYGPQLSTERSLQTATQLQNGRWLIAGGVNYNNDPQASCEIYDPATDNFVAAASMGTPRMGHSATLLADGRVFVAGGLQAVTVQPSPINAIYDTVDTTEIYDPVADTWSPGPHLSTPRAGQMAFLRPDNKVMLCGGISWDNLIIILLPAVRSSCDVYNPTTNTMSPGPSMATAHSLTDATALGNNRWLVAGGINALTIANPGTTTAVAEIYDATTNTWSSAGSMATARGNQKVIALGGGRWMHVGGANGTLLSPVPLASTEIYDQASNSWSAGPSLTIPRAGFSTFSTPTGQVMVFGGGTSLGAISNGTEWYFF